MVLTRWTVDIFDNNARFSLLFVLFTAYFNTVDPCVVVVLLLSLHVCICVLVYVGALLFSDAVPVPASHGGGANIGAPQVWQTCKPEARAAIQLLLGR